MFTVAGDVHGIGTLQKCKTVTDILLVVAALNVLHQSSVVQQQGVTQWQSWLRTHERFHFTERNRVAFGDSHDDDVAALHDTVAGDSVA